MGRGPFPTGVLDLVRESAAVRQDLRSITCEGGTRVRAKASPYLEGGRFPLTDAPAMVDQLIAKLAFACCLEGACSYRKATCVLKTCSHAVYALYHKIGFPPVT